MDLLYTAHVPPGDGPFPAVLALHGFGASAHDLLGLAPALHGGGALVLCPQGPLAFQIGQGMLGFGWAMPPGQGAVGGLDEYERAADAVRAFLDSAQQRYPIERRKVVLLGFSQGGVVAYLLALREPQRFAGLIALSSWLPGPLDQAIPQQPEHENFPAFVAHGTEDPMIPVARGQESRELLRKRGVSAVYREYEMGHEIRPETLRDLVTWLDEKVLSPIQLV
jgi:phospholipase/carboxylesterase